VAWALSLTANIEAAIAHRAAAGLDEMNTASMSPNGCYGPQR
jgi:hypothetical protein